MYALLVRGKTKTSATNKELVNKRRRRKTFICISASVVPLGKSVPSTVNM